MKKLSLSLDTLEVQSFTTSEAVQNRGTVHGEQQCTCQTICSCPGCPTCDATCPQTCWESCNGTCATECFGPSCWETCERTCYTGRCICYLEP